MEPRMGEIEGDRAIMGEDFNTASTPCMFEHAMSGNWNEVIAIYGENPSARLTRLTRWGDTAMHIAVLDGLENVAEKLVASVPAHEVMDILKIENETGNTPLHLAAVQGSKNICECIVNRVTDPCLVDRPEDGFKNAVELIGVRNLDGENPLFLAARHGKMETFLFLNSLIRDCEDKLSYCRRSDGRNILHCAISDEHFVTKFMILRWEKSCFSTDTENPLDKNHNSGGGDRETFDHGSSSNYHGLVPPNYATLFKFVKIVLKVLLVIFGFGAWKIEKVEEKKKKHKWAFQVMEELIQQLSQYRYDENGKNPQDQTSMVNLMNTPHPPEAKENTPTDLGDMKETAILDAAKMGVVEMVEKLLDKFPVAIQDMNNEKKNIVLLAVEHRQPKVYEYILKKNILREHVFQATDRDGNNALHLAANLGDDRPWLIPGAALQLQWEIKWFKYIKSSMPPHFFSGRNKDGKTPREIFTERHREMVKDGGKWLTNTSQSCSVVATLIATVAFTTSATVPGGTRQENGHPTLEGQPAFDVFSMASLVALGFSISSLAMFLSILTSRYQQSAFGLELPLKVILGLSSLFLSISSMLVSFCAGHFFVLEEKLKYAAFPVYVVTCLPVTLFAVAQFPLYVDLLKATFMKVPQRTYVDLSI